MLSAQESNKAYAMLPELSSIGITGIHVMKVDKEKAMVIQTPNGTAVIMDAKCRYISKETKIFDILTDVIHMNSIQLLEMGFTLHLG